MSTDKDERIAALEAERDALAAHVERLTEAACVEGAGPKMRTAIDDGPSTTSLARRDARMKAEATGEALDALEYMDREVGSDRGAIDATRDELRDHLNSYRRQAEEAS